MEGNSPLALSSWVEVNGPNSWIAAMDAVDAVFDPEQDDFLNDHPALADFIKRALYGRIIDQSQANGEQYRHLTQQQIEDNKEYVLGNKTPAELTDFLYRNPELDSIETARRTSLQPNVFALIDRPVRNDLDSSSALRTTKSKSAPLYRIKDLNLMGGTADRHYVLVDRKRTVRQHFGGEILTIVRNSLVLHDGSDQEKLPEDIRNQIDKERQSALSVKKYDYDQHEDILRQYIEDHLTHRSSGKRPVWMLPGTTTYYAARRSAIKAPQLLEFDQETV